MDQPAAVRTVITYGSFDLFHIGHLNLLRRLRSLGDKLIVAVSTDEFNEKHKGKQTIVAYQHRAAIVESLKCVDLVIPEHRWSQKRDDIREYGVDVFAMGSDWKGKFDDLTDICQVIYLERTEGVSSTGIKKLLKALDADHIDELKRALELLSSVVARLD